MRNICLNKYLKRNGTNVFNIVATIFYYNHLFENMSMIAL